MNHVTGIPHLALVSACNCDVTKSSYEGIEQHPCYGTSRLQLQLDFISNLMRIGERLSQLPTKELRGILNCYIQFILGGNVYS